MRNELKNNLIKPDLVVRSKRKTIAIIVGEDGKLEVRAPQRMTDRQIMEFVKSKSNWILKRKAMIQAGPPPHAYEEGEQFFYLGELFTLRHVTKQRKVVQLCGDSISIRKADIRDAADKIEGWYRKEARAYLTQRLDGYANQYGFEYNTLRINGARTRWGSCNSQKKSLNFTWRLLMAPPEIVDYVVVHELCHLRHANHSSAFWAEVEQIMPDFKPRRKWLKKNGSKLRM